LAAPFPRQRQSHCPNPSISSSKRPSSSRPTSLHTSSYGCRVGSKART
jgi:hypothetical protein